MLEALALLIPLGMAGAVSPVLLTEQTVLLAGPDGRRAGMRFAAGVVLTLVVIVAALTFFGRAISLPEAPKLDASLDLVAGAVLVSAAMVIVAIVRRRGPDAERMAEEEARERTSSVRAAAALPFGAFSMATNFTTLALMVPAAKAISTADTGLAGRFFLIFVLVAIVTTPAWIPVALSRIAPGPGRRALAALQRLIERQGLNAIIALLGAAGLFFLVRGLVRLLG